MQLNPKGGKGIAGHRPVLAEMSERSREIFRQIVDAYVETGEPVGSSHIAKISNLGLSSATIRNLMKELEEDGFLAQPYTSAGRIPTVKCYRYYVKNLMKGVDLTDKKLQDAKRLVENVLREKDADIFALKTTQNKNAFISLMNKLAEKNLADPNPPEIVKFLFYDHPPISERVKLAEEFKL